MGIVLKGNAVNIPRQLKDKTLPWTPIMTELANRAKRNDSLNGFQYIFGIKEDAKQFYVALLTKPTRR